MEWVKTCFKGEYWFKILNKKYCSAISNVCKVEVGGLTSGSFKGPLCRESEVSIAPCLSVLGKEVELVLEVREYH